MKSVKIIFVLLVLSLVVSCGAGDDLNDTATCAELSQIEVFCMNKIDPDNAKDDEYIELFKIACEEKLSDACTACVFDKPCNVAAKLSPYASCVTDGKCEEVKVVVE